MKVPVRAPLPRAYYTTQRRRMITMRVEVVDPDRGEVDRMIEAFRLNIVEPHADHIVEAHTQVEIMEYPRGGGS